MTSSIDSSLLPTLYTVQEVASHLKVSQRQVRRWIATGRLQAHKLGHLVRIAANDLALFLSKYRKE